VQSPALKYYANALAQLFFPIHCAACGNALTGQEEILCLKCALGLPFTRSWQNGYNPAAEKFLGRIDIVAAHSFLYFTKEGIVQHLIHQLKYGDRQDIAEYLGKMLALQLENAGCFENIDFLIPVPLHPRKKRQRGYNQSLKICKGMEQVIHIPVLQHCLVKIKHTSSQTHKTTAERIENVKDAFAVRDSKIIKGKNILLVDDVLTTGSTLESCTLTLLKAAEVTISIATLASALD
jgi:ComF family protein